MFYQLNMYSQYHSAQIFKNIQQPIDYQKMQLQQILLQKQMLQKHIKFMNIQLNEMTRRKMQKIQDNNHSRKLHKGKKNNSRLKTNQRDHSSIQMQISSNNKLLILLKDQYNFLKTKISKVQKQNYQLKCNQKIKQTKQSIVTMKQFLIQRKKKNIMNSKKINTYDNNQIFKQFLNLQQDYISLCKKKQQYAKRMDKIVQDNAKVIQEQSKLEEHYQQAKRQTANIINSMPNQAMTQHSSLMYGAKCKKLQLSIKKGERNQQNYKKRYYHLLKDYQKQVQNVKDLDNKIQKISEQIELGSEQAQAKAKKLREQRKKSTRSHNAWKIGKQKQPTHSNCKLSSQNQQSGFLLTELKKNSIPRLTKNSEQLQYTQPNGIKYPKSHSDANCQQRVSKLVPLRTSTDHSENQNKTSKIKKPHINTMRNSFRKSTHSGNNKSFKSRKQEQQSTQLKEKQDYNFRPTQRKVQRRQNKSEGNQQSQKHAQKQQKQMNVEYGDDFQHQHQIQVINT